MPDKETILNKQIESLNRREKAAQVVIERLHKENIELRQQLLDCRLALGRTAVDEAYKGVTQIKNTQKRKV